MKRGLALCLLVGAAALLARAEGAAAAVTCTSSGTYPSRSMVLNLTAGGDNATVKIGPGSELRVNGASCSPTSVYSSQRPTVYVVGAAGDQLLALDLTGGQFHDNVHDADLHFLVDLAGGTNDNLVVTGSNLADFVVGGANGINLDAGQDADVDVLEDHVEAFVAYGGGGGDIFSGAGSFGTGGPPSYRMVLRGEAGPDILVGSPQTDSIRGGPGNDRLRGLGGFDSVEYNTAPSGVTVDLAGGSAGGGDGSDALSGFEDVFASSYADFLRGTAGVDALSGNSGNDYVEGRGGADQLYGGPGSDTAVYSGAAGPVTVSLQTDSASGADGNDALDAFEFLAGSPFGDTLVGDDQANFLFGLGGADTLYGMEGNDTLVGGAGNDTEHGGIGTDFCSNGPGTDIRIGCEMP